jgi:hypothetical protein
MNTVVKVNGFEIEISGGLNDAFVKVINHEGGVIADLQFDQDMPVAVEHIYIKMDEAKMIENDLRYEQAIKKVKLPDKVEITDTSNTWLDADLVIQRQLSHLESVVYSAYVKDADGNPKDNLGEIAIHGEATILWDHAWVQEGYKTFKPTVIVDPTWFDLCGVANSAIGLTGDNHHIYFEGLVWDEKRSGYQLVMGS